MKPIAFALLLGLAASGANAQVVYRCGNAYSQLPCAQGRAIDAGDARSEAQRADAERVAAAERRLAAEMRRERLDELAAQRPAAASSLSGAAPARVVRVVEHRHAKKKPVFAMLASDTDFVAVDPSTLRRRGGK